MNNEIVKAALDGVKITIESDCWPLRRKPGGIRVTMTKQTWNGVRTMAQEITLDELPSAALEEAIGKAVRGMTEIIETGGFFTK